MPPPPNYSDNVIGMQSFQQLQIFTFYFLTDATNHTYLANRAYYTVGEKRGTQPQSLSQRHIFSLRCMSLFFSRNHIMFCSLAALWNLQAQSLSSGEDYLVKTASVWALPAETYNTQCLLFLQPHKGYMAFLLFIYFLAHPLSRAAPAASQSTCPFLQITIVSLAPLALYWKLSPANQGPSYYCLVVDLCEVKYLNLFYC